MRLIDPAELRMACVFPGTEDHFRDWRDVTVRESPHLQFLRGDETAYRLLILTQFGPTQLLEKIERFNRLVRHMKEGGFVPSVVAVRRYDGTLLIKDGNHRAAAWCYLAAPQIKYELFPLEVLNQLIRVAKTAYPAMDAETVELRLKVANYAGA